MGIDNKSKRTYITISERVAKYNYVDSFIPLPAVSPNAPTPTTINGTAKLKTFEQVEKKSLNISRLKVTISEAKTKMKNKLAKAKVLAAATKAKRKNV